MKTLSEQYKLIKEGKGDIEFFKKSAINQMGGVVSHLNSFDDMVNILKNKGVIVENEIKDTSIELSAKNPNKVSESDIKYIIDTSKNAEEFQTKMAQFLKDRKATFTLSPDKAQSIYNNAKKKAVDTLLMKEGVKEDAKTIFEADRVNPYELLKGIKVELKVDMNESTEEDVMEAKRKAVANLQKDPLFYSNKIAGVKKVDPEKRADTMKFINKKKSNFVDDLNAMKSVSKLPKANVTDRGDKEKATRSQMRSAHKKSLKEIINNYE